MFWQAFIAGMSIGACITVLLAGLHVVTREMPKSGGPGWRGSRGTKNAG
jgi:hypothetical protein